jgi:phenylacetate-coenzyme A ligase PaaK-like adenylate-forming protein
MRAAGAVRHRTETPREDPVSELLEHDRWSRERLLDHQRAGVRALLSQAVASSPYYREALGPGAGAGEIKLEDLPTLSKATEKRVPERSSSSSRATRHELGPSTAGFSVARGQRA